MMYGGIMVQEKAQKLLRLGQPAVIEMDSLVTSTLQSHILYLRQTITVLSVAGTDWMAVATEY